MFSIQNIQTEIFIVCSIPGCNCSDTSKVLESTTDNKGKYHSYGDNPALIFENGDKIWYKHGNIHRKNKPAIIRENGTREWYNLGSFYKIIYSNGNQYRC